MKKINWLQLTVAIIVSLLAGIVGTLFTGPNINDWYSTLVRPELAPPNWVFRPVWTTLFLLMGIAAYLVWQKGMNIKAVKIALGIFLGQLVLNTLWSAIFFGQQSIGLALIEILILWLAIAATIIAFAKISRLAAWLLVPYIAWVSFATYLNYAFYVLNN